MGLFGPGQSFSRLGDGTEGKVAHKVIEDIAGGIEMELKDTPGEYFALQAGGMLFASQQTTVSSARPVRSMDESLARAAQIMTAFSDKSCTEPAVLRVKANEVYVSLCTAAKGTDPAVIVGQLNDYLHYVDNSHLKRRAPIEQVSGFVVYQTRSVAQIHQANERSRRWQKLVFLPLMLLLPLVVGAGGIVISLKHPEMKTLTGKFFFGSLAVSGSGQALFFGKRGTALVIILCAMALIFWVY